MGRETITATGWIEAEHVDAVIDLGAPTTFTSVATNFYQEIYSWTWLPQSVAVGVSDDGNTFTPIGSVTSAVPETDGGVVGKGNSGSRSHPGRPATSDSPPHRASPARACTSVRESLAGSSLTRSSFVERISYAPSPYVHPHPCLSIAAAMSRAGTAIRSGLRVHGRGDHDHVSVPCLYDAQRADRTGDPMERVPSPGERSQPPRGV